MRRHQPGDIAYRAATDNSRPACAVTQYSRRHPVSDVASARAYRLVGTTSASCAAPERRWPIQPNQRRRPSPPTASSATAPRINLASAGDKSAANRAKYGHIDAVSPRIIRRRARRAPIAALNLTSASSTRSIAGEGLACLLTGRDRKLDVEIVTTAMYRLGR